MCIELLQRNTNLTNGYGNSHWEHIHIQEKLFCLWNHLVHYHQGNDPRGQLNADGEALRADQDEL